MRIIVSLTDTWTS